MLNCTRWLAIEAAAVTAPAPAEQTRSSGGSTGQVTWASQRSRRADALFRRLHWAGYTGVTALPPSRRALQAAPLGRLHGRHSAPAEQTRSSGGSTGQVTRASQRSSRADALFRRLHWAGYTGVTALPPSRRALQAAPLGRLHGRHSAPAEQTRSSGGSTGQVTRASQRSRRADALFRRLHWAGYTGVTALPPSRRALQAAPLGRLHGRHSAPAEQTRSSGGSTGQVTRASQRSSRAGSAPDGHGFGRPGQSVDQHVRPAAHPASNLFSVHPPAHGLTRPGAGRTTR